MNILETWASVLFWFLAILGAMIIVAIIAMIVGFVLYLLMNRD